MRDVRPWRQLRSKKLFEHRLFSLEEQSLEADNGDHRTALVLHPGDWVNMIALSDDDRVLLVRQWRYGTAAESLEIPGGVVEPEEEDLVAARRELLEETGFEANDWQYLGTVEPNPAFQSNRCSSWLARGLRRVGEPEGDGEEEIRVEWAPLERIPELIESAEIRHSLVIAAFYLYERWQA